MNPSPSRWLFATLFSLIVASCGTQRRSADADDVVVPLEIDTAFAYEYEVDTSAIGDFQTEQSPLRSSYPLVNDLVHTKLDVRFNWNRSELIGKAWLTLEPRFYPTDSLELDAKNMLIHKMELTQPAAAKLNYTYSDSQKLKIKLNKTYKADEPYTIYIEYTSRPDSVRQQGSAAITDAKGLYFIDPKDTDPHKPRQLWTQGETESNSAWFPTIDKPNAKTTFEIAMTVDTGLATLSNGVMTSTKKNTDGTRTDTWKLDKQPFAPYLVMMAVGKFAVVKDKWKNIPVDYYVDPAYKPYARDIFGNTPEMLTYYSNAFGHEYPWSKYAQVVVHDFVSGAMENVTASVFFNNLHQTRRELLDNNHEDIIAHELSHHWFGDLVTIEEWGQIPLNEAFATYAEYLWLNHKYGNDEGQYHLLEDLHQYMAESQSKQVPLIRYRYEAREDMFDAHSYQKGGRVLHMLHKTVGDDAFFAALKLYLERHKYGTVEIEDLRQAFEEVTGHDYKWFFDQWFLNAGHPNVNIETSYNDDNKTVNVTLSQTPSGYDSPGPWRMPLAIDVYTSAGRQRHQVVFNSEEETFTLPSAEKPLLVNVDAEKMMLWVKTENKTANEFAYQYANAPLFMDRIESVQYFAQNQGLEDHATEGMIKALDDKFWRIRGEAANALDLSEQMAPRVKEKLIQMAQRDPKSMVRAAALSKLSELGDTSLNYLFTNALKDSSYAVMATGLGALADADAELALAEAKKLMNETNASVAGTVMYILAESGDSTLHGYFERNIANASSGEKFSAIMTYGKYLGTLSFNNTRRHMNVLYDYAANDAQWFIRYAAVTALYDIRESWNTSAEALSQSLSTLDSNSPAYNAAKQQHQQRLDAIAEIDKRIGEMKKNETNEMLRSIMTD